jgi:hypothetical protein
LAAPYCSQRFLWSHSNPCGENSKPRRIVISAAGGCQYLAMKMAASTEVVSTQRPDTVAKMLTGLPWLPPVGYHFPDYI